jgi:hypothetical protein
MVRAVIEGAERIFALRYGGAYSFLGSSAHERPARHPVRIYNLRMGPWLVRVAGLGRMHNGCAGKAIAPCPLILALFACVSPSELFGTALGRARLARGRHVSDLRLRAQVSPMRGRQAMPRFSP